MAITKTWDTSVSVDAQRSKVTYEGLSTDSKPTTEVGINDEFRELDTGNVYYFDGSAWVKGASSGGGGGSDPGYSVEKSSYYEDTNVEFSTIEIMGDSYNAVLLPESFPVDEIWDGYDDGENIYLQYSADSSDVVAKAQETGSADLGFYKDDILIMVILEDGDVYLVDSTNELSEIDTLSIYTEEINVSNNFKSAVESILPEASILKYAEYERATPSSVTIAPQTTDTISLGNIKEDYEPDADIISVQVQTIRGTNTVSLMEVGRCNDPTNVSISYRNNSSADNAVVTHVTIGVLYYGEITN